jgi:uncharacterized damage-inducible protein DinB
MDSKLVDAFKGSSVRRLRQYRDRIGHCLELLEEDQIWLRGSANANAVGNLLLHLNGNVRQWIVSGVGGAPDARVREEEFAATGGIGKAELLARLSGTVEEACAVISGLDAESLASERTIQAYTATVLEAVYHVVEHFAMHSGQIMFVTKALTGEDLGFYKHLAKGAPAAHGQQTP